MDGLNDVTDAFDGLLIPVVGQRYTGSYVDGRWEDDAPTPLKFDGVVQNASPSDMKVLEEGQRSEIAIKIHTTFELIDESEENQTRGDIIEYKNSEWLVYNVAPRHIGNYYKAIAIRQVNDI